MKISDEKWNEIIAKTQASIDQWNALAKKHDHHDTFHCEVLDMKDYHVLATEHKTSSGWGNERKAVAHEVSSGELRPAKPKVTNGKRTGFMIGGHESKSWQTLDQKDTAATIKVLKLTNFVIVSTSSVVHSESPNTRLVRGFNRQDNKQLVYMVVDVDPADVIKGLGQLAAEIAGPEYCFHMSETVAKAVADEHKNILLSEEELHMRVPELRV